MENTIKSDLPILINNLEAGFNNSASFLTDKFIYYILTADTRRASELHYPQITQTRRRYQLPSSSRLRRDMMARQVHTDYF